MAPATASVNPSLTQGAFVVRNPDLDLSPMTGMTRKHYIECAQYVLGRAFRHVKSFDAPIIFPLVPGKSYPQPGDPEWRYRSYEFEALERTFNLAAPLIHVDPEISIGDIKLRDYYCHHFYNALTPGHANSLPMPEDLPDATYQFTCEFGGLTKTLLLMPDVLWPYLTQQQRDEMAVTISKWAHHRTTQNNWRLFNICALSFLKKNGYAIDDDLLKSHLMWIASYHAGNGWYLEQSYNYYTISLFVVYGTIWSRSFGREHYPEIADLLEKSFAELFQTYANFFGRNGFINMWARSICYRSWISGGFPASFLLGSKPPHRSGLGAALVFRIDLAVHRQGGFLPKRHPQPGLLRPSGIRDPELQLPGEPVHHVSAVHLPRLARRFAVLDGEGERRHVGGSGKAVEENGSGKTGDRSGESRKQRKFGDHLRQGLRRRSQLFEAGVQHAFSLGGPQSQGRHIAGVQLPQPGPARLARRGHQFLPNRPHGR